MGTSPISFSLHPLDKNFVAPKPIEEAPHEVFYDLQRSGDLLIEHKRNGHASLTVFTGSKSSRVHVYSRGINQLTAKIPTIIDGLRSFGVHRDTLIAGELVVEHNGVDDLGKFGSIARSNPERAIALQETHRVKLIIYNILVYKGKSVIGLPYEDRLDLVMNLFGKHKTEAIEVACPLDVDFDTARDMVTANSWEGLVLYSKKAGSTFHVDGVQERPPRPYGCWKWKPYCESDFVATGWVPSTSEKFRGQVKDLLIAQYDPNTNQLVHWGKVGVGLKSNERQEFANNALYPMVFEVKFERRTPNTRLIGARILRRRFDKSPKECFSPAS